MKTRFLFFGLLAIGTMGIASAQDNVMLNAGTYVTSTPGISNTCVGKEAGLNITTGYANLFLGIRAGMNTTIGRYNIFAGEYAGFGNLNGNDNVFIGGQHAGGSNTDGMENVFLGSWSGQSNLTGNNNTFLGAKSGNLNRTGGSNVFLGYEAGFNNTIGSNSIAIGNGAAANAVGSNNIAIGQSAYRNGTGTENVAIGFQSGVNLSSGIRNLLVGYQAGAELTTGEHNTIIGKVSVNNTPTTATAVGNDAHETIIIADGSGNQRLLIDALGNAGIGLGNNVRAANRLEVRSSTVGSSGLRLTNLPSGVTAITNPTNKILSVGTNGDVILVNDKNFTPTLDPANGFFWGLTGNSGVSNSIVNGNTTGDVLGNFIGTTDPKDVVFRRNNRIAGFIGLNNTAFGNNSFGGATTAKVAAGAPGTSNTVFGAAAGNNLYEGNKNTAMGHYSLASLVATSDNTAVGYQSGNNTGGDKNVFIGSAAGTNLTGASTGNVVIGAYSGPSSTGAVSNTLYIDNAATSAPLIGGNFFTGMLNFNVDNGVGSRAIIKSATSGISGLQFANLNSGNSAPPNATDKVLSVDLSGDVILTIDKSIYTTDGTLGADRIVNMNDMKLIFDTQTNGRVYVGDVSTSPFGVGNFPAISLPDSNYKLLVEGGILTEKVKVALHSGNDWADYVFADNYKLMPLNEVESFVKANKHLPGIDSAKDLEACGLDLAAMQSKQMEKIEELTLHLIEQNKQLVEQNKQLEQQHNEIEELKAQMKLMLEKR